MDGPSLQYVPVDFAFSSPGLAAHVEIGRGPATPADVAGVAVFAESADGTETYCDDAPPLPTSGPVLEPGGGGDRHRLRRPRPGGHPGHPDGRGAVFPTLQLRISHLRVFADPARSAASGSAPWTVGAACADDPDAICVPLA